MRVFILLLALALPVARATSCGPAAFDLAVKQADLVAEVEVLRHVAADGGPYTTQMEVRVIRSVWGKSPAPVLRVQGGGSMAAFPDVSEYPLGTRWVLALTRRNWQTRKLLLRNLYTPVACTGQGLLASGPIAYGTLSSRAGGELGRLTRAESIRLADLPAWIKSVRARP